MLDPWKQIWPPWISLRIAHCLSPIYAQMRIAWFQYSDALSLPWGECSGMRPELRHAKGMRGSKTGTKIAKNLLEIAILGSIPSGKLTQLWKITIFHGKTHYKWPFSIAMWQITRGCLLWKPKIVENGGLVQRTLLLGPCRLVVIDDLSQNGHSFCVRTQKPLCLVGCASRHPRKSVIRNHEPTVYIHIFKEKNNI